MPSTIAPCGASISGDTQAQMGGNLSAHMNGCSACQQEQERIRNEYFGPKTGDPRDN